MRTVLIIYKPRPCWFRRAYFLQLAETKSNDYAVHSSLTIFDHTSPRLWFLFILACSTSLILAAHYGKRTKPCAKSHGARTYDRCSIKAHGLSSATRIGLFRVTAFRDISLCVVTLRGVSRCLQCCASSICIPRDCRRFNDYKYRASHVIVFNRRREHRRLFNFHSLIRIQSEQLLRVAGNIIDSRVNYNLCKFRDTTVQSGRPILDC